MTDENPAPRSLPGQAPGEYRRFDLGGEPAPRSDVIDEAEDVFGTEGAAARLAGLIAQVHAQPVQIAADGGQELSPPFAADRDRIAGPLAHRAVLVVFGAFATPWSHDLGTALSVVRERHFGTATIAWRHYPDPAAHPRAAIFALAAEAAAARNRFWALARAMLDLRHDDPVDLHDAMLRASLDPQSTRAAMREGVGSDRIVADVASALASGVTAAPTLFVNGERYRGEIEGDALSRALDDAAAS
jgi:2-hydroxychromene-2-carboxylate isomerase